MKKFDASNDARRPFCAGWLLSIFFCAVFLTMGTAFDVSAQSLMLEKQKKEIDKQIPDYKKEIVEKCGEFEFEMEVDYASFADKTDVLSLIPTQGIKQAANALRRICTDSSNTSAQDEMTAGAVRKRIKRIVFQHIADPKKKNIELTKEGVFYVRNSYGTPSGITDYIAMARDLMKVL